MEENYANYVKKITQPLEIVTLRSSTNQRKQFKRKKSIRYWKSPFKFGMFVLSQRWMNFSECVGLYFRCRCLLSNLFFFHSWVCFLVLFMHTSIQLLSYIFNRKSSYRFSIYRDTECPVEIPRFSKYGDLSQISKNGHQPRVFVFWANKWKDFIGIRHY